MEMTLSTEGLWHCQIMLRTAPNFSDVAAHILRHQTFGIIARFVRIDKQNSPPEKSSLLWGYESELGVWLHFSYSTSLSFSTIIKGMLHHITISSTLLEWFTFLCLWYDHKAWNSQITVLQESPERTVTTLFPEPLVGGNGNRIYILHTGRTL